MTGKSRDFRTPHNRVITNYLGPGPLLLEEFTDHIAGSFLPPVPEHLMQHQEEIRKKKSSVSHFFSILEETYIGAGLSPKLESLLNQAFTTSKVEEIKITPVFLENLMDALDVLKTRFVKDSLDTIYLDKLISSIFSFYKLLKNG
jgi:hypothetical protein